MNITMGLVNTEQHILHSQIIQNLMMPFGPQIFIKNTAEKSLDQLQETKILVDYEGNVYWSRPGIVDTNCEFDLSNFPYDVQKCYFLFLLF